MYHKKHEIETLLTFATKQQATTITKPFQLAVRHQSLDIHEDIVHAFSCGHERCIFEGHSKISDILLTGQAQVFSPVDGSTELQP